MAFCRRRSIRPFCPNVHQETDDRDLFHSYMFGRFRSVPDCRNRRAASPRLRDLVSQLHSGLGDKFPNPKGQPFYYSCCTPFELQGLPSPQFPMSRCITRIQTQIPFASVKNFIAAQNKLTKGVVPVTGFEIACAKAIQEDGLLKPTTSPPSYASFKWLVFYAI